MAGKTALGGSPVIAGMSPASASSAHFGRLAERYDAVRPVAENWW